MLSILIIFFLIFIAQCRETPLHIAAKEGSYESLVKIIYTIHKAPNVWFHVDLNAQDDGGNSALHLALLNRNTREAIFLVTKAKINDSIRNYVSHQTFS